MQDIDLEKSIPVADFGKRYCLFYFKSGAACHRQTSRVI